MIAFALDEEQQLLQQLARKFAAEQLRPSARAWERAGEVPAAARRAFHELALGLLDVPEAMGGGGQPVLSACVAHEELAAGDPSASVALWSPHLAGAAVAELADDAQGLSLLAPLAAADGAERLGALAWSEAGGPLEGFATRATPVENGYRLDGEKRFVVNAGRAALTVVFAQLDGPDERTGWDGIAAFAVEGQPPGLTAGERATLLGLDMVEVASLRLDGVVVPASHRLGGRGDFAAALDRLFCRQLLVGAARQVGLARAASEYALAYTQDRHAFGKPVAHFQSIAFTLAELFMEVDAARCLLWRAAAAFDALARGSGDLSSVRRLCAQASAQAGEVAFRAANDGVQLLGGAGFIRDFPSEKWLREARALSLLAPTAELSQAVGAADLLGDASPHVLRPPASLQPIVT